MLRHTYSDPTVKANKQKGGGAERRQKEFAGVKEDLKSNNMEMDDAAGFTPMERDSSGSDDDNSRDVMKDVNVRDKNTNGQKTYSCDNLMELGEEWVTRLTDYQFLSGSDLPQVSKRQTSFIMKRKDSEKKRRHSFFGSPKLDQRNSPNPSPRNLLKSRSPTPPNISTHKPLRPNENNPPLPHERNPLLPHQRNPLKPHECNPLGSGDVRIPTLKPHDPPLKPDAHNPLKLDAHNPLKPCAHKPLNGDASGGHYNDVSVCIFRISYDFNRIKTAISPKQ